IGFITPISHDFCEQCNRLRLTSEGNLRPCLHHNKEVSIKSKSSEKILEGLKEAIKSKDSGHNLNDEVKVVSKRPMNKIGG
ncbi:GTP 3',8-cyclase MoaA, partial [Candidatus Izimaplasma bacterium]|nr:GTP 3',8-cyclase MoaA [Candidatus Izimaplasma bacterium]